jgi:hypothetical protein
MVLHVRIHAEDNGADRRRSALFYGLAGLELVETTSDPAAFQDQTLYARTRQNVRRLAAMLPPAEFLGSYRQVLAWSGKY